MVCRVCGGPSIGTMPCYRCMTLLIEMHSYYTPEKIRHAAAYKLFDIVAEANGGEITSAELRSNW